MEEELTPFDWQQPFAWGIITAFAEDKNSYELPEDFEKSIVAWADKSFTILVRHVSDIDIPADWPDDFFPPPALVHIAIAYEPASAEDRVDFEDYITCDNGLLSIGDAEIERVIKVHTGIQKVQITCFPKEDADSVIIRFFKEA